MALVTNTGAAAKVKAIVAVLTGFTATGTSTFGSGSDINCDNVEYTQIGRPDTEENEEQTVETNLRTIKDSIENNGWATYNKMQVFNDENGQNWKAFVAAKQTGATGTFILKAGTNVLGAWKAKVSSVEGGDGGAADLDTSFTPTLTLIEEVNVTA